MLESLPNAECSHQSSPLLYRRSSPKLYSFNMEIEDTTEEAVYTDFSDIRTENFDLLSIDPQPSLPIKDPTGNESTVMSSEGMASFGAGNEYQITDGEMNLEAIFYELLPSQAGKRRKSRSRSRKCTICPFLHSPN